MKALLLAALLFQTALTNKDVLDMLKSGLSPEIVAAKIRSTPNAFDTSPAALKELKEAGVPDSIILAMVERPAEKKDTVLVPEGTAFSAELLDDVSSETAAEGDPVTLKTTETVKVNGQAVIKTGAIVKGVVAEVQRSGSGGRAGMIRISLKTVNAVDGQKIKVSASRGNSGTDKTHRAQRAAAEQNPFSGMVRGGKAKIRAGVEMTIYTEEDKQVRPVAP